jgi:hypothetical protein
MKWPNDRKFVDKDGKILDHWRGPMGILEPLLGLSQEQYTALLAAIEAFRNATEEEDPLSLSAQIGALEVDSEPDFSADYAVGYDGSVATRIPLSLIGRSSLISSTPLSGNASVNIEVPATFNHARLFIKGMSFSTTANGQFSLSEDAGTTPLAAAYELFNAVSIFAATTAATTPNFTPSGGSGAAAVFSVLLDILNIAGSDNKFVSLNAVLDSSGSAYTGSYIFASTAPVNAIQVITSAGTFDAGTADLWGVP